MQTEKVPWINYRVKKQLNLEIGCGRNIVLTKTMGIT